MHLILYLLLFNPICLFSSSPLCNWNTFFVSLQLLPQNNKHTMRQAKQNQHDRSTSRCERSKSSHRDKHKPERHFLPAHELKSFEQCASPQRRSPQRQKEPTCRKCESLIRRGKEREEHFKQIVAIYHLEMDKLKDINHSLREQLETLHQQEQQARKEVEQLRRAMAECQSIKTAVRESEEAIKRRKDLDLCISPIQKGREPIVIQRITEKLLSELQSPTFSQLLAGTPQVSRLENDPAEQREGEKENALRAQFQRLMGQCEITSNRSKKTTLRKQMASIANQLASLGRA